MNDDDTPSKQWEVAPRATGEAGRELLSMIGGRVSPALQIMLDDRLFERARLMAKYLSEAKGFVPPHLIGKPQSCLAVITRSLTWKLDPFAVAQCTYETPGGQVGYEGKLCQAIIENSGQIEGGVTYEHFGNWDKIQGKYEIRKGSTGKDFAARTWTIADAQGLGVIVRAKLKNEAKPREFKFLLAQAFPLNSTLWATDPMTQICYTAVRRFASVRVPGLFMGVPFDMEDAVYAPGDTARVVNEPAEPREPQETKGRKVRTVIEPYALRDARGERMHGPYATAEEFAKALLGALEGVEGLPSRLSFFSHNLTEIERCIAERPDIATSDMRPVLEAYEAAEFDAQSASYKAADDATRDATEIEDPPVKDPVLGDRSFVEEKRETPKREESKPRINFDRETGEIYDERNPPPPRPDPDPPIDITKRIRERPVRKPAASKTAEPEAPATPKYSEADLAALRLVIPMEEGAANYMRWCYDALNVLQGMKRSNAPPERYRVWREANKDALADAMKRNRTAVSRIEAAIKAGEEE